MSGAVGPVELFGTDEPPPARRLLRAGPLSAVLEEGNLRDIRFAGVEAVRAISYLARDASWGTCRTQLSDLAVEEDEGWFEVRYRGLCASGDGRFAYAMRIRGEAGGRLTMEADGEALADFVTNRTGFVVLHPAEAAGSRLLVRHGDGSVEETTFPDAISPDQPAFDIAALTHEPASGLTCMVAMEGDAFEMEDQRNWADASFKTYVRPLSKPRPYVIPAGAKDLQRITVELTGRPAVTPPAGSDVVTLAIGEPRGRMPATALFLDPEHFPSDWTIPPAAPLCQDLIVRLDLGRAPDAAFLREAASFAALIGARVALELVCDTRDPRGEAAATVEAIERAGLSPSALLVAPRREFATRPSATLPDGEHRTGAMVAALRAAGVACPIGAGTPSYFTELNRNPPDADCDFVFFAVAGTVHAADDLSVMETLSVYPALIDSARRLLPGRDIWLGPCTIGVRHNPYGASVAANPHSGRVASARDDPRHGALFGAAFATGVAAQAARAGVARLTLAAPAGPFGLVGPQGRPRPIHAVQSILAAAAGTERLDIAFGRLDICGVAFRAEDGMRALIANVTAQEVRLALPAELTTAALVGPEATLEELRIEGGGLRLPAYRTALLSDRKLRPRTSA